MKHSLPPQMLEKFLRETFLPLIQEIIVAEQGRLRAIHELHALFEERTGEKISLKSFAGLCRRIGVHQALIAPGIEMSCGARREAGRSPAPCGGAVSALRRSGPQSLDDGDDMRFDNEDEGEIPTAQAVIEEVLREHESGAQIENDGDPNAGLRRLLNQIP